MVRKNTEKLPKSYNVLVLQSLIQILCIYIQRDIPVDMKYIAEPSMHSMPAVTPSPNQKWLACQSMDNKIMIFTAMNRFKLHRKKTFKGHMVAGYACQLDFSPDMRYEFLKLSYCLVYLNL